MKDIIKNYKRPDKAKKRLTDFDFSKEGSHVALVDAAANGHEVLITKAADEVLVSLSMEQFLIRFFDMWRVDASALALIMGYESEIYEAALLEAEKWDDTWDKDAIENQLSSVMLLKSASDQPFSVAPDVYTDLLKAQETFEKNLDKVQVSMTLEDFLEYFFSLETEAQEEQFFTFENRANGTVPVTTEPFLSQRVNSMDFMKSLNETKDFDSMTGEQKVLSKLFQFTVEKNLLTGVNNSEQDETTPVGDSIIEKGGQMADKKEEGVVLADLQKSLEDQAEIIKQLKADNDALKLEKDQAFEAELIEKAQGFEFVSEEQAPVVGKLLKSLEAEDLTVLLDVFKAAKEAIEAKVEAEEKEEENADMFVQKSASGEGEGAEAPEDARLSLVNKALGIKEA